MVNKIENEYFEWLYDLMTNRKFTRRISYRKLLMYLHNTEFTYLIDKDENRAKDGINLRRRFAIHQYHEKLDVESYLTGPCSVLEMMVALAIRCEETIMDNPEIGDRTCQWFWQMVTNLGLGGMYDDNYDRGLVIDTITDFLNREYLPNGEGGLFTINNTNRDLRRVEIWTQMCWFLNNYI